MNPLSPDFSDILDWKRKDILLLVLHEKTIEHEALQSAHATQTSYHPYVRATRTRVTFSPDKDIFGYQFSEFKEGKHGEGKKYFYWRAVHRVSVKYQPEGYFLIKRSGDGKSFSQLSLKKESLFKPFGVTRELIFCDEFREWVDSKEPATQHPLFAHYNLEISPRLSAWDQIGPFENVHIPFFADFMRSENPMELTRRLFGVTRYRRDLVKAVASTSLSNVVIAWAARGTMPTDWIVTFLRENANAEPVVLWTYAHSNLRKILKYVRPQVQKRIMREVAVPERAAS